MEKSYKNLIADHLTTLKKDLDPNQDLISSLSQSEVLTPSMEETVKDVSAQGTSKLSSYLLDLIPTRGPEACANFVRALWKSGQGNLAKKLDPRSNQDYGPYIDIEIEKVTKEIVQKKLESNRCYRSERSPRGRCVIMNFELFEGVDEDGMPSIGNFRKGSQIDEENLKVLFKKLHFDVEVWRNLTFEETKAKLLKESKNLAHKDADAFFLIAMSHGNEGVICTSDGKKLAIEKELADRFNAAECPGLAGKPKIFLIQACQGTGRPTSTTVLKTDSPSSNPTPIGMADAMQELSIQNDDETTSKETREFVHVKEDFVFGYATVPGSVCYRFGNGSTFLREFVITCSLHAHKEHIVDILHWVAANIKDKQKESQDNRQAARTDDRTSKRFFFFPGYCAETSI